MIDRMNEIAQSIRNENIEEYQKLRYPNIPDGEPVMFTDSDFSDVNFSEFAAGFFQFNNCNLDDASGLYGQPITIESCSARQIDMRGVRAIIYAQDSDFTGMLIDEDTALAYDGGEFGASSTFTNCTMDSDTTDKLVAQGVCLQLS